eukprot:1198679-Pyramimonas_sp.AAC.1
MCLELQMSYRVAWHSIRKNIIRGASLKYLDDRKRPATRGGTGLLTGAGGEPLTWSPPGTS